MNRALNQATSPQCWLIGFDLCIDRMKMFPVDMQSHHVVALLYYYVQSIAPITFGFKLPVGNLACSTALWEFDIPAEMQIISYHSTGMARFRVDWHSPNRLASSLWNSLAARNPGVHVTPVCTSPVAQKAHGSSLCCAPTAAAALRTVPGGLPSKQLMSQLSSCASKSSLFLNTCSLPIAPFAMSSNTAKAAIVFNSMHCNTLLQRFYIHSCNCRHMGVVIVHQC